MSGNLNPFEEEEANPRHQSNLHMTVGKVGKTWNVGWHTILLNLIARSVA